MSRRILVADDSSTIQKVIKIAFSRFDTEMVETSSYLEALSEVGQKAPDVLIIDASLPGAHGPEDFRKLREEAGGAPLLLLVGTYEKVDEDAFRAAGLDSFLKKPFESNDIVSHVDRLLGGALLQGGAAAAPSPNKTVFAPPPPPPPPVVDRGGDALAEGAPDLATHVPPPPPPPPMQAMQEGRGSYATPVPPPLPITDSGRKGRKAFDDAPTPPPPPVRFVDDEEGDAPAPVASPLPPIPPGVGFGGASGRSADEDEPSPARAGFAPSDGELARLLDERLATLVKKAVEDYCDRHFKSLAREVIASELRRLADEKARHLVDN